MQLLRRIAGYLAVGIVAQAIGIAAGIAQARTLGPEGKSVLAYAAIGLSMVLTASDGLTVAVLTQVGRDRRPVSLAHAALLRVVARIAVPAALAALAAGAVVASQRPLLGAALAIPLGLYVQGTRGVLLARGDARAVMIQGTLNSSAFGLVLIALLLVAHLSAYGALALWVAAWFGAAAFGWWAVRRAAAGATVPREQLPAAEREQLRRGLRNGATTLAGYLNLRIDVFLVSALLGVRELGIYTLAIASGELLWNLSQPVAYAALDRIAGDPFDDAARLAARLTRHLFALLVPLGLLAALVGPPAIAAVYGPRFASSGLLLRLLLPGLVVYAARVLIGYFILVRLERPFFLMWTQLSSAALCAGIFFATFRSYGAAGAAAATSATYLAVVVVLLAAFCRGTGLHPRDVFIPRADDLRGIEQQVRRLVTPWLARRAQTSPPRA